MNETTHEVVSEKSEKKERRQELVAFLVVTLVIFPALAIAVVGGYGFAVWIYQMIAGPPGPPGG